MVVCGQGSGMRRLKEPRLLEASDRWGRFCVLIAIGRTCATPRRSHICGACRSQISRCKRRVISGISVVPLPDTD